MEPTKPAPTSDQIIAAQTAEITALKGRIAELEKAKAQTDADEKLIADKMRHGISRGQAINIIARQRDFATNNPDRTPAGAAQKATKALAEARKLHLR